MRVSRKPAQLLRRLYGLTPAEARVALAMLDGGSLVALRDRFAVSENTLRTQIQRVYGKTGTRGQSSLIRLLSTIVVLDSASPWTG